MVLHWSLSLVFLLQITGNFAVEYKVIELDHVLDHQTPYFVNAGAIPFSYEVVEASNNRGFWLAFGKYTTMASTGTSVASPYNAYEQGITVDQIPVEKYFGDASVIDLRSKVATNDTYIVSAKDIEDWVAINGVFPNNSFVLINFGWEKGRFPDQLAYFGDAKTLSNLRFPGVSLEALKAILNYETTHGINLIAFGSDAPLLGYGPTNHVLSLIASLNKYVVRNLRNLESLPAKGAKLLVTPLKIRNSATAQARAIAHVPQ